MKFELQRRRETEIIKLKKDLESANAQLETFELQYRKKSVTIVSEMQQEIESLQKHKSKYE